MSCGNEIEIVTGAGRIVHSPNYPKKYPAGLDCKMLLLVNTGAKAAIKFLNFSVDSGVFYGCYDWINIYDGRNSNAEVLKSQSCGYTPEEQNVIATNNSIFITFKSAALVRFFK